MRIEDFVSELQELGFTKCKDEWIGPRPLDDFVASYDPPKRLADAIFSLNIGGMLGRDLATYKDHNVMFQGLDYEELGSVFGPSVLAADEDLLAALRLDGRGFLEWFYSRPVIAVSLTNLDSGKSTHGFMRRDNNFVIAPDTAQ
jgi:hypothetical protein